MRDPYQLLGVNRDVSADGLKRAFRKLAKTAHPDLHPGDTAVAERFKEITAAYDLLSDPEKRGRFDRGEIDASGNERAGGGRPGGRGPAGGFGQSARGAGGSGYGAYSQRAQEAMREAQARAEAMRAQARAAAAGSSAGGAEGFTRGDKSQGQKKRSGIGAEDLFAELFGSEGVRSGSVKVRGEDFKVTLQVSFAEAALGAKKRITLPDRRSLEVSVPAGVADGQTLRLKGQGQPGLGGAVAGDAYVQISIEGHAHFRRDGQDVHLDLPISLSEAVLGGPVKVPTIDGQVEMKIPAGSNTGTVMRLRGKGVAGSGGSRGDQYVTLSLVLPEPPDPELKAFVEKWKAGRGFDPRRKAGL